MSGKHLWIALVLWGICRTGSAQGLEVGAGIGRGCTGDSSGFCSGQTGPMWAVHGGYWITDYVQVAVRFAALPLDDFMYSTHRDDRFNLADDAAARSLTRIDITTRNRSRWLSGGEILYYFAGARRFGFVLGAGIGELTNRSVSSCVPAGCAGPVGAGIPGRPHRGLDRQRDRGRRAVRPRDPASANIRRRTVAQLRRRKQLDHRSISDGRDAVLAGC